jgi:hypothetical protein
MRRTQPLARPQRLRRWGIGRLRRSDTSEIDWLTRIDVSLATRLEPANLALAGSLLGIAAALLLWVDALRHIDPVQMNDWGLVSVFPLTFYAAILLLTMSYCALIARPTSPIPLLLMHIVVLILIIHGTPTILYTTVRYSWSYKHVGIIDYILRHHSVDPNIAVLNIYHNWPGFFALGALFTNATGFHDALGIARWAPVYFNLLDVGALILITKTLTDDRRIIWLSPWFFYLTNWVGQDYFSPQAFSYFLYLVIIGICLRWFRKSSVPSYEKLKRWLRSERLVASYSRLVQHLTSPDTANAKLTLVERCGLVLIVLLLYSIIVSSHQLTPFIAIFAVSALVIFQRCTLRWLPALMIALNLSWLFFVAWSYVGSNLRWILESIGKPTDNLQSNFISLGNVSQAQRYIASDTRFFTAAVGLLAVCGFIRRIRNGYLDTVGILLIGAPLLMLGGSAYGGEILFRLYFFALPFFAFFIAAWIYPSQTLVTSRYSMILAIVLSLCLFAGFLLPYYGKERSNYFTNEEFAASQYLYDNAPPGALWADAAREWPLLYRNYEIYSYVSIDDLPAAQRARILNDPANELAALLGEYNAPAAYFIITRSQRSFTESTGRLPRGTLDRIEEQLLQSDKFRVFFVDRDAIIFSLNKDGGAP